MVNSVCTAYGVAFAQAMALPRPRTSARACVSARPARVAVTMRGRGGKRKSKSRGPGGGKSGAFSKLSQEDRARLDAQAAQIGMKEEKASSALDRKFNDGLRDQASASPASSNPLTARTLYQRLEAAFGKPVLDSIERVVFLALAGLLVTFLASGITISSLAFFKATGKPVPDALDSVADTVEEWFTPALFAFLATSSMYGLYKQSQLNSGEAQYDERKRR